MTSLQRSRLLALLGAGLTLAAQTTLRADDATPAATNTTTSASSTTATATGTGAVTNAPSPWSTSAAAGLTITRGNSHTMLATVNLQSTRKTADDTTLLGADATYGETSGVRNAEQLHGFGQYNRNLSADFYYGLRLDALHDGVADVRYRLTLAPLAGYYILKHTNTTLSVEAGPALIYQEQGHVDKGYLSLRLGERFEHKFSASAKLWQTFEIIPEVDKFDNYYINFEIGVESALTKHVNVRTYIQDTYYNLPAAGREKNDVKLVGAIAYKF